MQKEIEAMFLNINKNKIRAQLSALGFTKVYDEFLQKRRTYQLSEMYGDMSDDEIFAYARIRQEHNRVTMAYKHITDAKYRCRNVKCVVDVLG